MAYVRKNRLPKPRLQLRLMLGFLGITSLALVVQVLLLVRSLVELSYELGVEGDALRDSLPGLSTQVFLFSFLVLLPSVLVIGMLSTFRLAGPIYRFERYLADVVGGRENGPCQLRDGDELQDLCTLINRALEARAQRALQATEEPETDAEKRAA